MSMTKALDTVQVETLFPHFKIQRIRNLKYRLISFTQIINGSVRLFFLSFYIFLSFITLFYVESVKMKSEMNCNLFN